METSRRDARFDNLKGILIFLVVFGHLLELVGGPAAAWLYRLIYSFHMPAFVFCSGWFARFDAAHFFRRLLLIVPKRPLPFAAALGQYTLPVFLLHGFFVRSLRLLRPDLPPLMGIGLAVLAALTLCAILGNRFTASLLRPTFCAPQLNRPVLKPRPSRTRHPAR